MLRLITDFDGVLVDISERYYQVYQFCLDSVQYPNQPLTRLTKAQFWNLKRSRTPEAQIGLHSGLAAAQIPSFVELRRTHAHAISYFQYDVLIPGILSALHDLRAAEVDLVVMTLRRDRELAYAFNQYPELEPFFPPDRRFCVPDAAVKDPDIHEKPKLMARALQTLPLAERVWMAGDTEADILSARFAQIPSVGVLSGIRDRATISNHQPDHIVADFPAAARLFLQP